MARAIWSGSISFGLVNVPVKVYTATRDHAVHFHQIDKASGARIRYEKVSGKTGKEVPADALELGYEMDKGKLVVVDPTELAELRPKTTRTIEITDFVELADIDPVHYNRTYWLAPDGEGATHAYRLLAAAMQQRERAGIGMVVMRNKQYLAAIRPREDALALSTMRFADEVLHRSEVDVLPAKAAKPPAKELRLATQIIDALSAEWDPKHFHDTYTEQVRALLKRRADGQEIPVEEAPAPQVKVTDLMEALQASLDASGRARPSKSTSSGPRSRSAAKAVPSKPSTRRAPAKAAAKKRRGADRAQR